MGCNYDQILAQFQIGVWHPPVERTGVAGIGRDEHYSRGITLVVEFVCKCHKHGEEVKPGGDVRRQIL